MKNATPWCPRNLFHCEANGILGGRFGDYIWAANRSEAIQEFERQHGVLPSVVKRVRREW
jgi:hypothetical protein